MEKVTSADGTAIAYDRLGDGPAVVLICGGSADRVSNAGLAALLAQNFTVYNYDRRGHGDSGDGDSDGDGDGDPIEREFEDLDAILAVVGGSARLCGTSSGATLAVQATAAGRPVTKLALWEPLEGTDELPVAVPTRVFTGTPAALAPALKEFLV